MSKEEGKERKVERWERVCKVEGKEEEERKDE